MAWFGGYTGTVLRPSTATFVSNLLRGGADNEKLLTDDKMANAVVARTKIEGVVVAFIRGIIQLSI